MCFKGIIRKVKAFFGNWLPNRGYKFVTVIFTVLWCIGILINPPLIFVLTVLWTIVIAILTWSYYRFKQALDFGTDISKWTLKSAWQQIKDWREGR